MKYALLLMNLAAVYFWPSYQKSVASMFQLSQSATYVVAGAVGFVAAWSMGKAFMSSDEAEYEAWKKNEPEYLYDSSTDRFRKNSRDADPESIKRGYVIVSLIAWLVQIYFVYKAFRFY